MFPTKAADERGCPRMAFHSIRKDPRPSCDSGFSLDLFQLWISLPSHPHLGDLRALCGE
jgi:hypothetical protein